MGPSNESLALADYLIAKFGLQVDRIRLAYAIMGHVEVEYAEDLEWQDRALAAEASLAATGKQQVGEVHPDDQAVDAFAVAMKEKMAAALRSAPDKEFRDPDDLAEYLGSLVSDDEEWDAAQAAIWGVRAFQGDATVKERLQAAIEGECGGLSITTEQAAEILHYVLQPLYYAERESTLRVKSCGGCGNSDPERRCIGCGHDFAGPQLSTVTPPRDLRTKLGDA